MYFIHPEILWGLFAVLIPLIIHLFNFRRYRKLPFSNIEFLKNITRQTRKQNKLKHLIVLLLRMGAVSLIVIAFASPRFGKKSNTVDAKVKSIYIDNSFSMMAEGENGMLFENARRMAADLINNSGRDVRYLIQTNDYYSGKLLLNRDEALKETDRLKVSSATRMLSSVAQRQRKMLNKTSVYESFWFSDFQQYSSDVNKFEKDTLNSYYFFPLSQVRKKNIYIDSCYFTKPLILPGKQAVLKVILANASDVAYEKVPLTLFVNDKKRAVAGVDMPAKKRVEVSLSFTTDKGGWQSGKLAIEDYPVTFDDELYFAFNVNSRIKVLDVYDTSPDKYIKTFYQTDSLFAFNEVPCLKLDVSAFSGYELIILDALSEITSGLSAALLNFVNSGGNLLYVPRAGAEPQSVNGLLNRLKAGNFLKADTSVTRVKGIKTDDKLFKTGILKVPENALLPVVRYHFPLKYSVTSGVETLLTLLNGDDLLVRKKSGNGNIYLLTAPLDKSSTDFALNPLFVPVMYGVAITTGKTDNLFYFMGENEKIVMPVSSFKKDDNPLVLKLKNSDYRFIPGQQRKGNTVEIFPYDGIKKAGIYEAVQYDSTWFLTAFNYNRYESEMSFYSTSDLDSLLKSSAVQNFAVLDGKINNVHEVINQQQKGAQIWKLFIIFALLMLLTEVMILRWWK